MSVSEHPDPEANRQKTTRCCRSGPRCRMAAVDPSAASSSSRPVISQRPLSGYCDHPDPGVVISPRPTSPSPRGNFLRHCDPQQPPSSGGLRQDRGGFPMSPNLAGLPPRYLRTPEACPVRRPLHSHARKAPPLRNRAALFEARWSRRLPAVLGCDVAAVPGHPRDPGALHSGEHAARPPPGLDTALDGSGCAKPDVLRCPHGHGGAFTKGAVE
jgi:hypothetical protein